jgi:hypothetical protein
MALLEVGRKKKRNAMHFNLIAGDYRSDACKTFYDQNQADFKCNLLYRSSLLRPLPPSFLFVKLKVVRRCEVCASHAKTLVCFIF